MGQMTPRAWDEAFDREFFSPEEIAESDRRVEIMAKLIDADALKSTLQKWARVPDYNEAERYILRGVIAEIEDAPAVNAIPVEWLEKQADFLRSVWDYDTCEAVRIVLKQWQREQEAAKDENHTG